MLAVRWIIMTFDELYFSVKKKIQENSGIVLDNKLFAVTLGDIYGNAFYVLWKDGKFSVEPYLYHDYNVCITAPQDSLELLFTERQHLFAAYMNKEMKIKGSFEDVMVFHQLLSYFTKEKYYVIQEEIISNMLLKQDMLRSDLGVIMESLHLLLTNSLLDIPLEKRTRPKRKNSHSP